MPIQMPIRSLPLDASRFKTVMCVVAPHPRVNRDTGEIRTDREGRPLYVVSVSVQHEDGQGASVLDVILAGEPQGITEGSRVIVTGLTANYWQMGDREGINFRASSVTPESSPASPAVSASASSSGSAGGRGKTQGGDA
ncbi:hypothetical protein [Streptomyces albidus (ex Kaewkla and Franco 2022)]|uniref:SCO3933 family regulatory protein n=1 Tax=Streptomyces albidus (ex Kaewkla and Franco 2022) TaxID=722709 RepID=UPI0015EED856|nr:hypothetical protein [Streptomyces albidus (ex Kaewkla and Franco 2022)]